MCKNKELKCYQTYLVNCPQSQLNGHKIRITNKIIDSTYLDFTANILGTSEQVRFGINSIFSNSLIQVEN